MNPPFKLLKYRAKFAGIALIMLSLIFAYLYFLGGKPECFNIKVFAIISVYLETKTFAVIQTNILDELAVFFFLGGFSLIVFSEEKREEPTFNQLRLKALFRSIQITLLVWILCYLLIYGLPVFIVSSFTFIFFMVSYYLLFSYLRMMHKRGKKQL